MFQRTLLNDLIIYRLQDFIKLQYIIKPNKLDYESKREKLIVSVNIVFKRYKRKKINIMRS